MEYRIQVNGMHCPGCKTLIKMSLEDAGFTNIDVNDVRHEASFVSDLPGDKVRQKLDTSFHDLKEYSYQLI